MSRLFSPDSPFYRFLSFLGDMIILNILWLLSCVPIITIGAATTAMYSALIAFDKKGKIVSAFFQSFRTNFRQATLLWLLMLAIGLPLVLEIYALLTMQLGVTIVIILVLLGALLYLSLLSYLFPMLARFDNTFLRFITNSLVLSMAHLPRTILIVFSNLLPILMFLLLPYWFLRLGFIWFLLGFALIAYSNHIIFKRIFASLLPNEAAGVKKP